ncbi:MAG: hypothetical protein ACQKBV_00250, partial [Puniceicoccales bacterium]
KNDVVYYQALTGRTMYSIPAASLRNFTVTDSALASQIKIVGETGSSDGIIFGPDEKIYTSALEYDAIRRTTPHGKVETVVQDEAIAWPDSFSIGPDNWLYFTTARIHEGANPQGRYGLYRIKLPE